MKQRGFTLAEALIAVTIGAILALIAIPAMNGALRRARLNSAVRALVSDVRTARSRAISTGWEFRVVGFHATTGGERANQYRLLGHRAGVSWPDVESSITQTATQFAGPWVDLDEMHEGVRLEPADDSFELTFDARGAAPDAATAFNPVALTDTSGSSKAISISSVGSVSVE